MECTYLTSNGVILLRSDAIFRSRNQVRLISDFAKDSGDPAIYIYLELAIKKQPNAFLWSMLRSLKSYNYPNTFNIDGDKAYAQHINALKEEGICKRELKHRKIKYLNNRIESDHGKLKRPIKPTLGFQPIKTAYAKIKGNVS